MPDLFRNTPGAILFFVIICTEAVVGSFFILFPLLPIMVLHPLLYRRLVDQLMIIALGLPMGLLEYMFDVQVFTSGDEILPNEKTLVIMNHRTMFDWLYFFQVLIHHSSVKGEKIILKRGPRMIPGFGWAMQMANYIFLERKWENDKLWLDYTFKYFKDLNYKGQYLIFPEGTDFCKRSKQRSDSYAIKNGLANYDYVLHPRTTGFAYCLNYFRDSHLIDSVLDVTVGYPDHIPNKFDPLKGNFPRTVDFHMQRYKLSEIPLDSSDVEKWCLERWAEKEKTLKRYYTEKRSLAEVCDDGTAASLRTVSSLAEVCEDGTAASLRTVTSLADVCEDRTAASLQTVNANVNINECSHQNSKDDTVYRPPTPSVVQTEQNGNSIKATVPEVIYARYEQRLANSGKFNASTIFCFWALFAVFAAVSLYLSTIMRYLCLIAWTLYFSAHFVGGLDLYQIICYNWLKRTIVAPQLSFQS